MFRSVEQLSSPGECDSGLVGMRSRPSGSKGGRGRGSAWGSISRVFARSRHRTKSGSAVSSGHESGMMLFLKYFLDNRKLIQLWRMGTNV